MQKQSQLKLMALLVVICSTCSILLSCIVTQQCSAARRAAVAGGMVLSLPFRTGLQVFPAAQSSHFSYEQYKSLHKVLSAHQQWQSSVLQQLRVSNGTSYRPPVLLIKHLAGGWGNRLPSLVTGTLMAALTGRVLMLEPYEQTSQYVSFNWDLDWAQYSAFYTTASRCSIHFNNLVEPDLAWCNGTDNATTGITATVMQYFSMDYELPLVQMNPAFRERLQLLAPAGDIFHQVSKQLFQPKPAVLQAAKPYADLAGTCLVGIHIRTKKILSPQQQVYSRVVLEQFASIARATMRHQPGTVFVAADTDVFKNMSQLLPGRHVWWSNLTSSSVLTQRLAVSKNPGTDLSAWVDLHLLSQCEHIIVTSGSSFGTMAAGIGNVPPIHCVIGMHDTPYNSTWFWQTVSSEPNMFKLGVNQQYRLTPSNLELMKQHPLYFHFAQGHP